MKNTKAKFLWGTATASHQVEGGNRNDWTEWEARGGSKDLSGKACNHWDIEQFRKDVETMKELGLNAYRMGIEWSRVMPEKGIIDIEALEHYRQMVAMLREAGITTMVTLHHFTNPVWFVREGGWLKASLTSFYEYVSATVSYLADYIDYWNTFNEPLVPILTGYLMGIWPPGKRGRILAAIRLRKRIVKAHNVCYSVIKTQTDRPVGIVHNIVSFEAKHGWWVERAMAKILDNITNQWILRHTRNDFMGVNFYMRLLFSGLRPLSLAGLKERVSDFGWEIVPESLTKVLLEVKQYGLPIYITENGVADAQDTLRANFIQDHVEAFRQAMKQGADVRGYFHWSLLDNFEWAEGFGMRFGLIEVDFETQERRIRPSAYVYRDIIRKAPMGFKRQQHTTPPTTL